MKEYVKDYVCWKTNIWVAVIMHDYKLYQAKITSYETWKTKEYSEWERFSNELYAHHGIEIKDIKEIPKIFSLNRFWT